MYLHKHLYLLLRDTQVVSRYRRKREAMDAFKMEKGYFRDHTMLTNYAFETFVDGKRRIIQIVHAL